MRLCGAYCQQIEMVILRTIAREALAHAPRRKCLARCVMAGSIFMTSSGGQGKEKLPAKSKRGMVRKGEAGYDRRWERWGKCFFSKPAPTMTNGVSNSFVLRDNLDLLARGLMAQKPIRSDTGSWSVASGSFNNPVQIIRGCRVCARLESVL